MLTEQFEFLTKQVYRQVPELEQFAGEINAAMDRVQRSLVPLQFGQRPGLDLRLSLPQDCGREHWTVQHRRDVPAAYIPTHSDFYHAVLIVGLVARTSPPFQVLKTTVNGVYTVHPLFWHQKPEYGFMTLLTPLVYRDLHSKLQASFPKPDRDGSLIVEPIAVTIGKTIYDLDHLRHQCYVEERLPDVTPLSRPDTEGSSAQRSVSPRLDALARSVEQEG